MAFPVVAAQITGSNPFAHSWTVNLPDGSNTVGDLLVILLTHTGIEATAWPAGWTELATWDNGVDVTYQAFYHKIDGTEGYPPTGASITVSMVDPFTSRTCAYISYRVTGQDQATAPAISFRAAGTSNQPDPAGLTPPWGSADTLWIAGCGYRGTSADPSAYPANYVNGTDSFFVLGDGTHLTSAAATRSLAAASEDPGPFTVGTTAFDWLAGTIAIKGTLGGGTPVSSSVVSPWEALAPVTRAIMSPWEALGAASMAQSLPFEALAGQRVSSSVSWEALTASASGRTVSWEALAAVAQPLALPWESTGLSAASATAITPWESLQRTVAAQAMGWEAVATIARTSTMAWEGLVGVGASGSAAYEALTRAARDGSIAWEAAGFATLSVIVSAAWESLQRTSGAAIMSWEALSGGVVRLQLMDYGLSGSFFGFARPDPASPVDLIQTNVGSRHVFIGPLALRPTPGLPGRLWYATDTRELAVDNGTLWELVGSLATGSGSAGGAGVQLMDYGISASPFGFRRLDPGAGPFSLIQSNLGLRHVFFGPLALRPAAGLPGRLWFCSDTRELWVDAGAVWELVGRLP